MSLICHNCESDEIELSRDGSQYICTDCGCALMIKPVNTASIGDNKKWLNLPSPLYIGSHRTGFHQTLCADCKTPTPLNDMFPTGPDNIFKCWSCAQIPVLADITD